MLALRMVPAKWTPWASISAYITRWVRTVASWQRSMVVVTVHQHLRLDDRHHPGFLAERRIARERMAFAWMHASLAAAVPPRW